jgi:hypothetical protein
MVQHWLLVAVKVWLPGVSIMRSCVPAISEQPAQRAECRSGTRALAAWGRIRRMTPGEALDEIHRLAARRKEAYRALDVLERQLEGGGGLPPAFRGFGDRPQEMARRERHAELVREIQDLRVQMERLRVNVPLDRVAEIERYWDVDHTASHSQLRDMGRTPPHD